MGNIMILQKSSIFNMHLYLVDQLLMFLPNQQCQKKLSLACPNFSVYQLFRFLIVKIKDKIIKYNRSMAFLPNKKSLQHRQQEKSCPHCKKSNQGNEIRLSTLKQNIQKLKRQNSLLQSTNIAIKKKLQGLIKVHSKCGNMKSIEQQLRSQLNKTMFAEQQTQIVILNSQVGQLKQQVGQIKKENNILNQQNIELSQIKTRLQSNLKETQRDLYQCKEQVSQLKELKLKNQQKIRLIQQRCEISQNLVKEKQQIVFKLEKCLHQTQGYYDRQKAKVGDLTIHKIKTDRAIKDKQRMLDSLTKASDNQLKTLSTLQTHNGKLTDMVGFLQNEMYKHRIHEEVLVDKLHDTQDLAWDKTIKLQMIKKDVHDLKLAL